VKDRLTPQWKCDKHPKYKGTKAPDNNCLTCLELYATVSLTAPRSPHKPTRSHKNKKRYSRKRKHRANEE